MTPALGSRPRLLVVAGPNGAGKTTIVDRWARSIANAASVAAEVERFYLYDNSVEDRDAQLVVRASDGRVVRTYAEPSAWTVPIIERLERSEGF